MNNKQDILNELKVLSPILYNLKEKEKSLIVPVNYFKQLTDIIITQTANEHGILAQLKKEKTEVPAGYFEMFGDHILTKIKADETEINQGKIIVLPQQKNKVFQLFTRVAIAASIVGVVLFGVRYAQQSILPVNNCADGIACLTQDEIYNYINDNSHDFDIQDVQKTVQPMIEKTEIKVDIDKKDATQYIEEHKNVLDIDDVSTDIF